MAKGKRKSKERCEKRKSQLQRRFVRGITRRERSASVDMVLVSKEVTEYLSLKVKTEPGKGSVKRSKSSHMMGEGRDREIKAEIIQWKKEFDEEQ